MWRSIGQASPTVPTSDAITWVGALSGGIPVAAVMLVICWFLWRRLDIALKRIEELQTDMLTNAEKASDRLLAERTELVPLLRDTGQALMRATVLWEKQANRGDGTG